MPEPGQPRLIEVAFPLKQALLDSVYLDACGLRKHALFLQLLQALIELAGEGTEERGVLENLSNHLTVRGVAPTITGEFPSMQPAAGIE